MRQAFTSTLLAFTAGFVDTVGFIALFGLFTAHVTGNFVLIGASIADFNPGILGKLLALPVFVVTVAAARLFVLRQEDRKRDATDGLLATQMLFLALFLAAGVAAAPFTDADAPFTILTGQCGVIAMAVQNAAGRTVFANLAPTTVMTGNVTQIVVDAVDVLARRGDRAAAKTRFARMLPSVLAFGVGALSGAFLYVAAGFWCLALPLLGIAAILIGRARAAVAS